MSVVESILSSFLLFVDIFFRFYNVSKKALRLNLSNLVLPLMNNDK